MRRRAVLIGVAAPVAAVAAPPELRFRILREGRQIGVHRVVFTDSPDGLVARTEADIAVRIAGITVFRLTHRFEETWRGDRLESAVSRHDRNGRVTEFTARAEAGGLRIAGGEAGVLPADAAPLTWWDARRFGRPLFANDTGRALRVTCGPVARVGGGQRWVCSGDEQGESGYAADGAWLEWETRAEDGSLVTYARA